MTLFFITTSNYKINNIDNSIDSQKTISTELSQKNMFLMKFLIYHYIVYIFFHEYKDFHLKEYFFEIIQLILFFDYL